MTQPFSSRESSLPDMTADIINIWPTRPTRRPMARAHLISMHASAITYKVDGPGQIHCDTNVKKTHRGWPAASAVTHPSPTLSCTLSWILWPFAFPGVKTQSWGHSVIPARRWHEPRWTRWYWTELGPRSDWNNWRFSGSDRRKTLNSEGSDALERSIDTHKIPQFH